MNREFVEMLSALSAAGAEYLVVGAHALAAHGVPRATGDLDLVLSREDLIRNKRATGRPKDLLDVESLG